MKKYIFIGLLVIIAIFSTTKLCGYINEYKIAAEQYEEIKGIALKGSKKKKTEDEKNQEKWLNINWGSLKKINNDVVGWIDIPELDISYPIVQGKNNDVYLHQTINHTNNFAGCIFLEMQNKNNFTDYNSIIYGHNMKDGSMFGKLKRLEDKSYFDKISYIYLYTPEKSEKYEIFACYKTNICENNNSYQLTFYNDKEEKEFFDCIKKKSKYKKNISYQNKKNIITLSTCTYSDQSRLVIHAKKVKNK